jgi:uncharacterized Ntn-hydrolase superfamily protein
MNGLAGVAKIAADFGGIGVLAVALLLLYRLADKWGGAFLTATQGQTAAMTQQAAAVSALVETVKDGQNDQREVLIAVRMLNDKIDQQRHCLEGIDDFVRERTQALAQADQRLAAACEAKRCGFAEVTGVREGR